MNSLSNLFWPVCFLLCFHGSLSAQEIKINQPPKTTKADSLKDKLLTSSGRGKLEIITELNMIYRDAKPDIALDYANQYYSLALNLADSVEIVKGGRMIAYSLMDFARNKEAVELLNKSLGIAQRNLAKYPDLRNQIKSILNNAGIASMTLSNYDRALDYQFQSLKLREEDGDKGRIINCLNNIGMIFYNLEDYDGAVKYLQRAEQLCQEVNETQERKRVLINLGLCHVELGDPKQAIILIEKAFRICGSQCSQAIIKEGQEALGFALLMQKEYLKAKAKFLASLEISKKQEDTRFMCENLSSLGQIEIALGNEALGISQLKYSLQLAEPRKLTKTRLFVYEELSKVYKKQKDLKNSLFFLERYNQLKDSVYSSALIKNLAKIQSDFAERENIKTIKSKEQILLLNEELIKKQKLQTILIASVAALLLILTGVIYKFYRGKLLISIKLDQKVKERTEELRQNNNRLVQANEVQQSLLQKIGRDGQSIISGIKGLCHMAQLESEDHRVKEYFQKVDENANKLLGLYSKNHT